MGGGADTGSLPSMPLARAAGAEPEGVSLSFPFAGNKKLTRWAQFQDGNMVDIHDDAATLDNLRTGRIAGTATRVMSKRVLSSAWNYCLDPGPGNTSCTILRRMAPPE